MKRAPKKRQKKRTRQLGGIERDILSELTWGDFLYSALTSARSNRAFFRTARERANYRYRRKCAIERLLERSLIQKEGERLSITEDGRSALAQTITTTRAMLRSVAWDHKWRIAAFDIPEKYATLRDKVRDILKRAGFEKLQNSIWIFPHECEELVLLIQKESILANYVLYGVLERIGNENNSRKNLVCANVALAHAVAEASERFRCGQSLLLH